MKAEQMVAAIKNQFRSVCLFLFSFSPPAHTLTHSPAGSLALTLRWFNCRSCLNLFRVSYTRDTHTRNRCINKHYAPLIGSQMHEHHKRARPSACIQYILYTCNLYIYIYIYIYILLYVCGGTGRTIPKWATLFMSQTPAWIRAFIRAWTTNSMCRRLCRGWRCKGHKNESKKMRVKKARK